MDWHLLPIATEALTADVALAAKGRFLGDPSHQYEHTQIRRQGQGDDAVEDEVMVSQRNARESYQKAYSLNNHMIALTSTVHLQKVVQL